MKEVKMESLWPHVKPERVVWAPLNIMKYTVARIPATSFGKRVRTALKRNDD